LPRIESTLDSNELLAFIERAHACALDGADVPNTSLPPSSGAMKPKPLAR